MHLIEPLEGAGEEGPHALYQEMQLQQVAGTCGVNASNLDHILGPRASAAFRPQVRGLLSSLTVSTGPLHSQYPSMQR